MHSFLYKILNTKYQIQRFFDDKKSFTLIETLIVVAILAALSTTAFVELSAFKNKHDLDLGSEEVVSVLKNAQSKAIQQEGGSAWGVRFINTTSTDYYQIFQGSSYSSSAVVSSQQLSGANVFTDPAVGMTLDIVFATRTGIPISGNAAVVVIKQSGSGNAYSIFVSSAGKISKILETGLVGYWPMDEGSGTTAYDASGSGNTATLYGTANWAAGRIDSALNLTVGSVPNNALTTTANNINNPTGLTLTALVYPTSYGSQEMTVIQGPVAYYLSVNLDGSINCYWYGTSPAGYHSSGAGTVPLNQWTQITCAWNGSAINLYTNGQLKNTVSVTGNGVIATSVNIGAEVVSRQFRGEIDDVRIYNRALSATEVQNLYNSY